MTTTDERIEHDVKELDRVTIRFAGDSGDGMQLTGTQFTRTAAVFGNDISTFPDYPAEIRAPAGSLPGVSGFQISFSASDIHTPGDAPDVLVAMNPAALKTNVGDLPAGGALIVNSDAFTQQNLNKAAYASNPLTDGSLKHVHGVRGPDLGLNERSLEGLEMTSKQKDLTKNFFALGLMFWLYERSMDPTITWIGQKFGARPIVAEANTRALKAGYAFGETTEMFHTTYRVPKAQLDPGHVPQHHGQRGDRPRLPDRREARQPAAVLRLVPDHAGLGHPPPAVGLQALRRPDLPGRGRDRGRRRRDRRVLRRRARAHRHVRPRRRAQAGGDRPRGHDRAAARRHRRPARRPVDRHADQGRAGGPAAWPSTAATARARRPDRRARRPRASASRSRSRPRGSRSST